MALRNWIQTSYPLGKNQMTDMETSDCYSLPLFHDNLVSNKMAEEFLPAIFFDPTWFSVKYFMFSFYFVPKSNKLLFKRLCRKTSLRKTIFWIRYAVTMERSGKKVDLVILVLTMVIMTSWIALFEATFTKWKTTQHKLFLQFSK